MPNKAVERTGLSFPILAIAGAPAAHCGRSASPPCNEMKSAHRIVTASVIIALFSELAAGQPRATPIVFTGSVVKGRHFERGLLGDLAFRLNPDGNKDGWVIWIGDPDHPDEDFAAVVTPPYRGVNARYIEGWHFRNSDNSAPNDGSVNAPQELREFELVADRLSYQQALGAVRCMLWACADLDGERARAIHASIPRGKGRLTITDLKLANLTTGEQASIEQMEFRAEVWLLLKDGGAEPSHALDARKDARK